MSDPFGIVRVTTGSSRQGVRSTEDIMATTRAIDHDMRENAGHRRHSAQRARTVRPVEVAVFLCIAIALALVSCLPTPADGAQRAAATRTVKVEASDSLWSIARDNAGEGVPTVAAVEEIRRLNGLSAADPLEAGTYLMVPCADRFDAALAQR